MPSYTRKVDIPGKTAQELYDAVAADIEKFLSKTPIGKFDIDRNVSSKQVKVKSSMVTATLTCSEGSITVDGSLSLFAAPFRSKLDEGINHWLSKTFKIQV